jgi:hypothetical protein
MSMEHWVYINRTMAFTLLATPKYRGYSRFEVITPLHWISETEKYRQHVQFYEARRLPVPRSHLRYLLRSRQLSLGFVVNFSTLLASISKFDLHRCTKYNFAPSLILFVSSSFRFKMNLIVLALLVVYSVTEINGAPSTKFPHELQESSTVATLYLAGDSTMAKGGGGSLAPGTNGWGEYLEPLLTPNITVVNRAIGGRSARSYTREGRFSDIANEVKKGRWGIALHWRVHYRSGSQY